MAGGRNRAGQFAAFTATAGEKNAFNIARTNRARGTGTLIAEPFGTAFYHQGSTRFAQGINLPITRGNPEGFLDLEHRSGAELVRGLTAGENLGTGIFLFDRRTSQEAASIIFEQLGRSDLAKQAEFKAAANSSVRNRSILFGTHDPQSRFLSSDFVFTGTTSNTVPAPTTPRRPTTPTSISVADDAQADKKRRNLGRSRGGTLVTGNAGLSDIANTAKKTLLG
ncbi:MAG: hypothetical protein CMB80_01735 [Flammeovirgaceae bacterium]|nr:hypothetical protein [Flammeovirgaceae bacterium]|tara:strand:+ start:1032 stop:1703 length:672 start_codon:yes stop_codon:yes gene_type:complete